MLLVVARHRRAVRRGRRRRGVRRRRDQRPRSAGRRTSRRRRRSSRLCAPIVGTKRARRCRARSSAPRVRPSAPARRIKDMELPRDLRRRRARASTSCRATRRSARLPSNTTVIAIAWARSCARSSTQAASIDADTYDDARRTTRRARRALVDLLADGEVMLTPSAPGAAPRRPRFDRRADLQPAVDVAGHALHQRAGTYRTRLACRSACRSSRGSAATGSRCPRLHCSSARSPAPNASRPPVNELTRWFVTYYFCIPPAETGCGNGEYSSPQIVLMSYQQQ